MTKKITGDDCVKCLKTMSNGSTAADIAFLLNTDSRAVATALRKPVKDGRVKWGKFVRGVATYTFLRSTPAKVKGGAA
jgi:hypothetical protein